MLQAIDDLPEEEREVFSLIRIQDVTQVEAAEILGVSVKTIQRRLNRSLVLLAQSLEDVDLGLDSTKDPSRPEKMRNQDQVTEILERILETNCDPAIACKHRPELLPEILRRLEKMRRVERQIDELFPNSKAPDKALRKTKPLPVRICQDRWL